MEALPLRDPLPPDDVEMETPWCVHGMWLPGMGFIGLCDGMQPVVQLGPVVLAPL